MIELVTAWDDLVNALGGAAMLAFGVWILTLTPRTRATKLLAVFAIAVGAVWVPRNLLDLSGTVLDVGRVYDAVLTFSAGLAVLGLTRELLSPYEGAARGPLRAAAGVAVLSWAIPVAYVSATWPALWSLERWAVLWVVSRGGFWFFFGALLGLLVALAWMYRYPPAGLEEATRAQALVISTPLMLWPAYSAGVNTLDIADPTNPVDWELYGLVAFVGFLGLAGFWLANAAIDRSRNTRARNLAIAILGMVFVGMLDGALLARWIDYPGSSPLWGLARLATVLGLGYAILRHEVLGIETKFRWGVSKTTLAGVFIAVFFVVSEGAQTVFAGFAGNELLGVLAAGALVFFLAPLQRLADQIAEKAVPSETSNAGAPVEARYREVYRMALADGEVSSAEERRLAELAEELEIKPTRAFELRQAVEEELGGEAT